MRYALANKSLFAYIQQDAAVLSKGPFRVVGRRYKKKSLIIFAFKNTITIGRMQTGTM